LLPVGDQSMAHRWGLWSLGVVQVQPRHETAPGHCWGGRSAAPVGVGGGEEGRPQPLHAMPAPPRQAPSRTGTTRVGVSDGSTVLSGPDGARHRPYELVEPGADELCGSDHRRPHGDGPPATHEAATYHPMEEGDSARPSAAFETSSDRSGSLAPVGAYDRCCRHFALRRSADGLGVAVDGSRLARAARPGIPFPERFTSTAS